MSTQDCLQQLCDEKPEFLLYYNEFLEFYSRPTAHCRIVICGFADVGKSALVNALTSSRPLPDLLEFPSAAAIIPLYIDTPDFNTRSQQTTGAWEIAIGADIIVLTHDLRHGALTGAEKTFLQSLRERFPDLRQRIIVVLTHGDKVAYQLLERLSAIHRNLATLFSSPAYGSPAEKYPSTGESRVPVLLLETNRVQALQQQFILLICSYDGGLPAMRTASIKVLLNTLDAWITGAIKTRKKKLAQAEGELSQSFSLWQRDLRRLGDTLRFRINDVYKR